MTNIYQEIVMDHYRNPRNRTVLEMHDFCVKQYNSACGDEVCFMGLIKDGVVVSAAFQGKGCVISQAAASMLTEIVINKSVDEIVTFDKETILAMIGMPLGPVRLMCALLPLMALHKGIKDYNAS